MERRVIRLFRNSDRYLSNFYPCTVMYLGLSFASVEHAYQAAKSDDPIVRQQFRRGSPGDAKRRGRTVVIRADWEAQKVEVMRALLQQKFAPGSVLAGWLRATGDALLIEGNEWGDTFWGQCRGVGANWLGRLLMEIRDAA